MDVQHCLGTLFGLFLVIIFRVFPPGAELARKLPSLPMVFIVLFSLIIALGFIEPLMVMRMGTIIIGVAAPWFVVSGIKMKGDK